jgi:hypothetical protein
MKTDVKPAAGCRAGFAFYDASGRFRQWSWGELKRDGLALYTLRDGQWVRVRSTRNLGSLTALAPIGTPPGGLAGLAWATPGNLSSRTVRAASAVAALAAVDPAAALASNRFAQLTSEQRRLVLLAHGGPMPSQLTPAQQRALEAFRAAPTDANIVAALAELAKGDGYTQWRDALAPVAAAFGIDTRATTGLFDSTPFSTMVFLTNDLDPTLAAAMITLVDVLDPLDRFSSVAPIEHFTTAAELVKRFADHPDPAHAALCHLARVDESTAPDTARRALALQRAGAITPQRSLELAALCPTSLELLRSQLHRHGSVDDVTAAAIEAAWAGDRRAAVLRYGDCHLLATVTLFDGRPADAASVRAVVESLGGRVDDAANEALAARLAGIDPARFFSLLEHVAAENDSAVPHASLALRLTTVFGADADAYLNSIVRAAPGRHEQRRAAHHDAVVPELVSSVLLARTRPEFTAIEDLDERRAARQAWGNAQSHSREKLTVRLERLAAAASGIDAEAALLSERLAAAKQVTDPWERWTQVNEIEGKLAARSEAKAAKAREHAALSALLGAYDTASDAELAKLVEAWVRSGTLTQATTLGLSMHDATYWLPADGADGLGAWLMNGNRVGTALRRASGVAELTLIAQAWSGLDDATRAAGYAQVLASARQLAGAPQLGDRHTEALGRLHVSASSAQKSLDLVRQSWDTPSPFPLTEEFSYETATGRVTARFQLRDDVTGSQQGMETNCCQHVEGIGAACATAGQTHPSMGFVKLTDTAGNTVAGIWAWADGTGGVCLDNLEGRVPPHLTEHVRGAVDRLADRLAEQFHTVTIGSRNTITFPDARPATPDETLDPATVGYTAYRDSHRQLVLRQRPAIGVVTVGRADGFSYVDGDSSVSVTGSTVTLTGPYAEQLAERMLPQMGPRTWNVTRADGTTTTLVIDGDERFRPRIDDLPASVWALSDEQYDHFERVAPGVPRHDLEQWNAVCNRDTSLMESALANGWDLVSARKAASNRDAAVELLAAAPPHPAVLDGVAAGRPLDQARSLFAEDSPMLATIEAAAALHPQLDVAKAVRNVYRAHSSADPAAALVALDAASTDVAVTEALRLVDRGLPGPDAHTIVATATGNRSHHGHLLDTATAPLLDGLTVDELVDVASQARSRPTAAPGALVGFAKLDWDQRTAATACDPGLVDPVVVEFVALGGTTEQWHALKSTVDFAPTGAQLVAIDPATVTEINEALDSVGVPRAWNGSTNRHALSAESVALLADPARRSRAAAVVAAMTGDASEQRYGSAPESAMTFAGLAAADVDPADAAVLARAGISASTLASCTHSRRLGGAEVARIATVVERLPEWVRTDLLYHEGVTEVACAMAAADEPFTDLDATLLSRFRSESIPPAVARRVGALWADPATRERVRTAARNHSDPVDILAAAEVVSMPELGGRRRPQREVRFDF